MAAETFTQTRLQDFEDCAYRYLLRYIRRLDNPTVIAAPQDAYDLAVERGTKFHRLAEQYFSGVPANALTLAAGHDPILAGWWSRLTGEAFDDLPSRRMPEITLTAPLGGVMLAAKIDLLAVAPGRVVIVDWKTSRRPRHGSLETRLQTRVYRWVASRAVEHIIGEPVAPDAIEMRYWFAADDMPMMIISYSQEDKQKDEQDLLRLIARVQSEESFSRTSDRRRCEHCAYRAVCFPEITPPSEMPDESTPVGEGRESYVQVSEGI